MTKSAHGFEHLLLDAVRAAGIPARPLPPDECVDRRGTRCRLCLRSRLPYEAEGEIKRKTIMRFWELSGGGRLDPLVLSPPGREYRTVSKRRVFRRGRATVLGLIDRSAHGISPFSVRQCAIEPEGHNTVFRIVQEELQRERSAPLAAVLRYVIVKGTYTEFFVLFTVDAIDPTIVRTSNFLSKSLTKSLHEVAGVFLMQGGGDERYYLDGDATYDPRRLRKLYGTSEIRVTIAERAYLFSPLSFSQVNQGMLGAFVAQAAAFLRPRKTQTLFDLYCGYGLFGLALCPYYRSVAGVEISHRSIEAARLNAARQNAGNTRFIRSPITRETIASLLAAMRPEDAVLLDPPRGGTEPGVIESIAQKRPSRVVHIFCNPDVMPAALAQWKKGGYQIERAVPLDMFPGTTVFEMLVSMVPATGD